MTTIPRDRPPAKPAPPDLLVLAKWEDSTRWLLEHTHRWSKAVRFTLTQRVQNHALDVLEMLTEARYERGSRFALLKQANLRFERMRHLLRIAHGTGVMTPRGFEQAMERIDEAGRMLHGWRVSIGERGDARDAEQAIVNARSAPPMEEVAP
jgi:23S rRNA-intervening sequence protein